MAKRAEDPGNPLFPKSAERRQVPLGQEPSQQAEPKLPTEPRGGYSLFILAGIVVTCLALIYYVANAHHRISDLGITLLKARGELASMVGRIDDSRDQISKLSNGLNQTRDETAEHGRKLESQSDQLRRQEAEYRRLTAGVRRMRADYRRELQAMEHEKADRSEVKQLEQGLESLKNETDTLKQKVVETEVPRSGNPLMPVGVRQEAAPSAQQAAAPESYGFQLQQKDGVLWLLNVGLDLKKVKISDDETKYDLEVRVDGNKIRKKDAHLNEPILVPVQGFKQPYRLVVTSIEKDQIKGFLSVPKA